MQTERRLLIVCDHRLRKWYATMIRVALFFVFWTLIGGVSSLADNTITTHGANSPAIVGDNNKVVIYLIDPQLLKTTPWEPRKPSSDHPHVAIDEEGKWKPQDGYTWVNPDDNADRSVRWVPGRHSTSNPHVVATNTEGEFRPQDGYTWVNPDDPADLSVKIK